MTPKQLTELEGFNPNIKWITKEKDESCYGWIERPALHKAMLSYWTASGRVYSVPFTLEWESDDWTKCIYEREKDKKDMIGKYIFVGRMITQITENDVINDFKLLTSEDIRMIMKANGIEKDSL